MLDTVVSRVLMSVCVLLSVAPARAVDDPADAIISEIISGAKTNSARAAKLLEVARSIDNQPKVYYKRFAKLHRNVDVQSIRAKADLAAVEKELAKFVILPKTLTLNLGKGVTMRLARIPAGNFLMGSPKTEEFRTPVESPQHEVTLARSFYMGVCEVTQTQWFAVMGSVPWHGHKSARSGAVLPLCKSHHFPRQRRAHRTLVIRSEGGG